MIYRIGTQKIKTPEVISSSGRARTPRQVVPWRDVAETCRTLDAVCREIPNKRSPMKIVDGIARAGFWGAVFRNRWPDCQLILNGENQECADVLIDNFSDAKTKILVEPFETWTPDSSDLLLYDFDAFTLKKLDQHERVLTMAAPTCRYLIIAESACFGFKFGNIKHYGVETEEEYYGLVDEKLYQITQKSILAVSKFSNAAMVLLGPGDKRPIKMIPQTTMPLMRGGKPYIGDFERSQKETKKGGFFE